MDTDGKRTHTNTFTPEQMECLRMSPHVKSVSPSTVKFTQEFRDMFLKRLRAGDSPRKIFRESGIDPRILGDKRIQGFSYSLRRKAAGNEEDGYPVSSMSQPQEEKTKESLMEERVRLLEHQLAYTQQEVEFLKKLQMADTEARRSWESKRQPK